MNFISGYFDEPEKHHSGWFKIYRFSGGITEIWMGKNYFIIERNRK